MLNLNEFLDAIEIIVDEKIKNLQFNRKIEGIIVEKIGLFEYKVLIQNNEEIIKSMNDIEYNVGDVVYIIVFNNNYSDKKILCRK